MSVSTARASDTRVWSLDRGERGLVLAAATCACLAFAAYAMLRPVRDALGVTAGVSQLPWLFWATFGATLLLQPLYGALVARAPARWITPVAYAICAFTLVAVHAAFAASPDSAVVARAFFVWSSVFNLFIVAAFWSLMAEVVRSEQALRLFGLIAAGISVGGILGPLLAGTLATRIGTPALLSVSAALLLAAAALAWRIGATNATRRERTTPHATTHAWSGFTDVVRSPYLRHIAWFVVLMATVTTVLYLEQQRWVAAADWTLDQRTQLFSAIDVGVQAGALLVQALGFAWVTRRFGFTTTLASVPAAMTAGLALLLAAPSLLVVSAVLAVRRVADYGLTRPARDALFTEVDGAPRFRAKVLIDTFVYRGADALSAAVYAALAAWSGTSTRWLAVFGVLAAVAWAANAVGLGRRYAALRQGDP